jgi:hypothetical protein
MEPKFMRLAISSMATPREIYHPSRRPAEGLLLSVIKLLSIEVAAPDDTNWRSLGEGSARSSVGIAVWEAVSSSASIGLRRLNQILFSLGFSTPVNG